MTQSEAQAIRIKQLEKQVQKLRKRLKEKQAYEAEMLVQTGAAPQYIEKIRRKDELALKED
jgi:hypothetical protein